MRLSRFLLIFGLLPEVLLAQQHDVPQVAYDVAGETIITSRSQDLRPNVGGYPGSQYQDPYSPQSGTFYGSTTYREIPRGPYEYWRRPDWSFYMARPGSSVESTTSRSHRYYPCRGGENCYRGRPSYYRNSEGYGYGDKNRSSYRNPSRSNE